MLIKINKSSLAEALSNVQTVGGGKTTMAVLNNVKIEAKDGKVAFTCTDLDRTIEAYVDCEVVEPGATTLPVKVFAAAVNKVVDGIIELFVDEGNKGQMKAGTSQFVFNGIAASDFPELPEASADDSCMVQSSALREMLRKTSIAMSMDDSRAVLNAVLLDFSKGAGIVKSVATDGRRLSTLECEIKGAKFTEQYVIPKQSVEVLLKKLPREGEVELIKIGKQLKFRTSSFSFITKLLDNIYPNYAQVIPKETKNSVLVNRVELLGAIDRISVVADGADVPAMTLTIGDNKIAVDASNRELGEVHDEVPVKYEGPSIKISFAPRFIRDVLSVLDEDEIAVRFNDGVSPAIIDKGSTYDYLYVVMPLRTL